MLRDAWAHFGGDILEVALAEIFVNHPRILEILAYVLAVNFGIDVPVDLHNVRPAVVVVIEEAAAPRDVLIIDSDAGRKCNVAESSVAVVVVEIAGVVGEIGFENVE